MLYDCKLHGGVNTACCEAAVRREEPVAVRIEPAKGYERRSREAGAEVMERVFGECRALRGHGQAEYAHDALNAFANFERVAERLGISREMALLVYAEKHWDGIASYVKGHKSQRESVKGRIDDMVVYLCLLRAMVEETEARNPLAVPPGVKPVNLTGTPTGLKVSIATHDARSSCGCATCIAYRNTPPPTCVQCHCDIRPEADGTLRLACPSCLKDAADARRASAPWRGSPEPGS